MTDISVYQAPFLPENLSWDVTPDRDARYKIGGTLDPSKFNAAQHYPNGYLPSGTVLGRNTTSGLLQPYLASASDGSQTAVGILAASVQLITPLNGQLKSGVGVAVLVAFGVVSQAALPFTSTNAAAGGYLDAAAKTALPLIYFAA